MKQIEVTEKIPLLDAAGNLTMPGYCKRAGIYEYRRRDVKANPTRIKEWDFYQLSNSRYTLQVTVADISLGGAVSINVLDRATGAHCDALNLVPFTFGNFKLDENAEKPHTIRSKRKGFDLRICVTKTKRCFSFKGQSVNGKPMEFDLECEIPQGLESLVMAVPFEQPKHFYYNQKVNSMPARGTLRAGDIKTSFDPQTDFLILDWGRGVWPYRCRWYWGNGSHRMSDGSVFGFEIGWGFGDMSAATENMLFFNGKGHKIGTVTLGRHETNWLDEWVFISDDGRFNMIMTPEYDNQTHMRVLGVVGNVCHQVYGKWNGTAVLDDGTILDIQDMLAFCELSDNRW